MSEADPRAAANLDEAARNSDGTYNGLRALSWLSEALHPGRGIPMQEMRAIEAEAKARLKSKTA